MQEVNFLNKFKNARIATVEEKQQYIKQYKRKYGMPNILICIFLLTIGGIGILGLFINCNSLSDLMVCLILIIVFGLPGLLFLYSIKEDKELIKKVMDEELYIVNCYSYDKSIQGGMNQGLEYYIKITDGENNLDEWFKILKSNYIKNKNNNIKVKLLFSQDKTIFDVIE